MRQSPTSSSCSSNYVPGHYPIDELFSVPAPDSMSPQVASAAADALAVNAQAPNPQAPAASLQNRVYRSLWNRDQAPLPSQNQTMLFHHLPGMNANWEQEREEYRGCKRRNLNPTVAPRDLGQEPIVTPAPSPLLNLLTSELFSDQISWVFDQTPQSLRIEEQSLEIFTTIVRQRRQMLKLANFDKGALSDEESTTTIFLSFQEMLYATRQENRALIEQGRPSNLHKEQLEVLRDFLFDRIAQKRIKDREGDQDPIENERFALPSDPKKEEIEDLLKDLLPPFALDVLKAQDSDFTKRFLQAQQLALLLIFV